MNLIEIIADIFCMVLGLAVYEYSLTQKPYGGRLFFAVLALFLIRLVLFLQVAGVVK